MTLPSDLVNILKPTKLVSAAPDGGIVLRDGQSRMEVRVVDAPATAAAVRLERIGHSSRTPRRSLEARLRLPAGGRVGGTPACDLHRVVEDAHRRASTKGSVAKVHAAPDVSSRRLRSRGGQRPGGVDIDTLFHRCRERRPGTRQAVGEDGAGQPRQKRAVREPDDQDVHRHPDFARDSARGVTRAAPVIRGAMAPRPPQGSGQSTRHLHSAGAYRRVRRIPHTIPRTVRRAERGSRNEEREAWAPARMSRPGRGPVRGGRE